MLELEKNAKKILRKSLKDNTLDYTIQFTVSSMEPGVVKYACQISSPSRGVEPITFIFDSYKDLEASLKEAQKEISKKDVELKFHESRVNTYKNKIKQHEARMETLNDPDYDEQEDNIPMEEMSAENTEEKEE